MYGGERTLGARLESRATAFPEREIVRFEHEAST